MRAAMATLILALLLVSGCGNPFSTGPSAVPITASGRRQTEARAVQGFSGVMVTSAARATVEQTGVESLEVTADDNVLPHVYVAVVGGQLLLGLNDGVQITGGSGIVFRLTARNLEYVSASGASKVETSHLQTPRLLVYGSAAATLRVSATADSLHLKVSGASRCDCSGLHARVADVTASGASYAILRVTDLLMANASGASTVEYFGDPVVRGEVSFGSLLRKVGD